MSTAILFHGVLHRSLKYTYASIIDNLISPLNDVDVFYHSWDPTIIMNPRAREYGNIIDPSDIAKFLPMANGIIESQHDFDESMGEYFYNKTEELKNYIRDLKSQNRMYDYFDNTRTKTYDNIIVARADVRYIDKLIITPVPMNYISIPYYHDWWGINDRFAISRSHSVIEKYCRRMEDIMKWKLDISNKDKNSEGFLDMYLNYHKIPVTRFDFRFQRVRSGGGIDPQDIIR